MDGRAFVSRFSPNRTDPKVLEAIFVQRHALAETWLGRLRDSALTEAKHHLLAVGPRGCGKSHLVALLVARLETDPQVADRLRIAWLPEDETTPSFWKFLLRILRALNARYGDEFPPPPRDGLERTTDERRARVLTEYLLAKLGKHVLLVVVENLDDVLRGLKPEGQKRWRAFLQEHPVAATLATSQQLTKDVSDRDRPFFNFFQIEPLKPLTADEAVLLLQKIAEQCGNNGLLSFLRTPTGRARVRAIHHLAGGGHRVFIILSEFATQQKLDNLVAAFEELLDELTPYYQERLRWLPDQQREIVEYLCRQARTVPVKEIAGELYLTEQTAASQLRGLKEKGYVTGAAVGRESRYELAEPLMRLCIEVKDPRREPIRLVVDFLRVWYDRERFTLLCERLVGDELWTKYVQAVQKSFDQKGLGPVDEALKRELDRVREARDVDQIVQIAEEIVSTTQVASLCVSTAFALWTVEHNEESLKLFNRAREFNPTDWRTWNGMACVLADLDRKDEGLRAAEHAVQINPVVGMSWYTKGYLLSRMERHAEALEAYNRAVELTPEWAMPWSWKALSLNELGRYQEAIDASGRAIELDGYLGLALTQRGRAKLRLGRAREAGDDLRRAIDLGGNRVSARARLVETAIATGDWEAAEQSFAKLCESILDPDNNLSPHLDDIICAVFTSSTNRGVWLHRIRRLVEKTSAIQECTSSADCQLSLLDHINVSILRNLPYPAYMDAGIDALNSWLAVWEEVARDYPDLSLGVRLLGVGVRFLLTKDERVLLDLVQEERAVLREVFKLDESPVPQDRE